LQCGFTLIEAAIVIAVLSVLATLAAPEFKSLLLNQGIKTGAYDLFSALEYSRSEAIKRNGNVTLKAGAISDGAWTTGWRLLDASNNVLRSWTVKTNITITEAASATAITFAKDGHMSAPVTPPKLQVASAVTAGGLTLRCIQVDLIGRAKIQTGACP
jgi:type IV fimbrial biogenesis protein FimT